MPTFSDKFSIIVPTWNAASHLDIVLSYYNDLGLSPLLIVDSKTADATLEIAGRFLCSTLVADNPTSRSQFIVKAGAEAVTTPWVLRLDDDELPSRTMLNYISEIVESLDQDAIVGFVRHQCAIRNGRLYSSLKHTGHFHRQWRLFQPRRVEYVQTAHTPGYATPLERRMEAPDSADMVHLDWIVKTPEERNSKIIRYDDHTKNSGSEWRNFYLADIIDKDFNKQLIELKTTGFEGLAFKLDARFASIEPAPVHKKASSMRLYLGSRDYKPEGYLTVDIDPAMNPDIVADITKMDVIGDSTADEVVAGHVLEHIEWPDSFLAMAEFSRVLRIGGKVKIAVPDMGALMRMIFTGDSLFHVMGLVYGVGGRANTFEAHRYGFTSGMLTDILQTLGFQNFNWWNSDVPDASNGWIPRYDNKHIGVSLNIEAEKVRNSSVDAKAVHEALVREPLSDFLSVVGDREMSLSENTAPPQLYQNIHFKLIEARQRIKYLEEQQKK